MATISEQEFKKLCDDIYLDRHQVYGFVPGFGRGEALLWMLLGCLLSLLSVPPSEQPSEGEAASPDPYGDAIRELLRQRMSPPFDPHLYLSELARKAETRE
ncbi:MAG TPA: hypothetical protein VGB17_06780 [Pyrinomonadaceae bacterium]|jgi:hypothetical protein